MLDRNVETLKKVGINCLISGIPDWPMAYRANRARYGASRTSLMFEVDLIPHGTDR